MMSSQCTVAVVGGGPAGLSLAAELARNGVDDVLVLEREPEAGGVPRHCGHSPYGLREFKRLYSGPGYARRLVADAQAAGVALRTGVSVIRIEPSGQLLLSTESGAEKLSATKIVLATGNRETPRSARLVSGQRPLGVLTTGALQGLVYLKERMPFRRPLIVGSELVSFSALLTCRHANIKPVAMVESADRVTAWPFAPLLPRLLGIPVLLATELTAIHGRERVEAVELRSAGGDLQTLDCDGVVFTGSFVSESSLVRNSHLQFDPASGSPAIDQFGRSTDPDVYVCGNQLHPVDTAGWCWAEGRATAASVLAGLEGRPDGCRRFIDIENHSTAVRYLTPQRIALPDAAGAFSRSPAHGQLQLRLAEDARGRLCLRDGERVFVSRDIRARRERRVLLPLPPLEQLADCQSLVLDFEPDPS